MLYKEPFANPAFGLLFSLTETVLRPFQWCFSEFVSSFMPVTPDKQHPWRCFRRQIISPVYLVILVLLLIPTTCAFIVQCLLHLIRKPYCLSVASDATSQRSLENNNKGENFNNSQSTTSEYRLAIATANVCLLPEFLSRFNNISQTSARANGIGENIITDQWFCKNTTPKQNTQQNGDVHSSSLQNGFVKISKIPMVSKETALSGEVVTHFPHLDFLCIQEAWVRDYSRTLIKQLHKEFPWILYDVGISSLSTNYFVFNSGLLFASRYPILDVDFKCFPDSYSQCIVNSKGLLMVKVLIQKSGTEDMVGYVFNTHLQAYQGTCKVLDKQLNSIERWTNEFRQQTTKDNETVLFDILCGDFNFDNMSPGDWDLWNHSIFEEYEDVCREKAGVDKTWAVGTEMRQKPFWDSSIQTPKGLQDAIKDPCLRQKYIHDATVSTATLSGLWLARPQVDKDGNYRPYPAGGQRRVDYVLYRKSQPLNVSAYNFVTRLASLTDHIPVSMSFCTTHPQES